MKTAPVAFGDICDQVLTQCRVLATLATRGPMTLEDLGGFRPLLDLGLSDIVMALGNLLEDGRIDCRISQVRYRSGDLTLRRDVPVYDVVRGGVPE